MDVNPIVRFGNLRERGPTSPSSPALYTPVETPGERLAIWAKFLVTRGKPLTAVSLTTLPRAELSVWIVAACAYTLMLWNTVASRRCSSRCITSVTLTSIVALAMRLSEPVLLACSSYLPGGSSKKLNLPSLSEVAD